MLKLNTAAFLAIPNENNKRVLSEGKVRAIEGVTSCQLDFEQVAGLAVGTEVTLFAETRGKFFQQGATVAGETFENGITTIAFALVGEPVSAEQRGSFRTTAVMLNLPVGVDRVAGCILADVSPEGVGVISPKPLVVGSTVDVNLQMEAFSVVEKMKVQGVKALPSGKLRFGLYIPGKNTPSRRTLEKMASHLQRVQLRRLAGAA
ncbi:MAG: hypothetical protein JWM57_3339 [Phycisphaerales bacterium]|nr:hypothetical protein [Phycisphaerales bacterium]